MNERAEAAQALLSVLFKRLPKMLKEHRHEDAGFRKRTYQRWKPGLDMLKMFVVMSHELGSAFNERCRSQAVADQNYKFEATVALHARALRVANEIYALLCGGYPDGALSRWRTLHELAVVATFLTSRDEELSKRFLAHRSIVNLKALKQYEEYRPRSNMEALEPGSLEAAQAIRDALINEFGQEFNEEMGWAYPLVLNPSGTTKCKHINLLDLEEATGLDHWRPRFRWASDDIHVGAKPYHASLGTAETALNSPVLLTGSSNSAFTDPAHMCVISLNLLNHALPNDYLIEEERIILVALRILSDEIGETFLATDRETSRKSARATSVGQEAR